MTLAWATDEKTNEFTGDLGLYSAHVTLLFLCIYPDCPGCSLSAEELLLVSQILQYFFHFNQLYCILFKQTDFFSEYVFIEYPCGLFSYLKAAFENMFWSFFCFWAESAN